ncbi:MAG: hypothetical protein ABIH23_14600 [bacterium]
MRDDLLNQRRFCLTALLFLFVVPLAGAQTAPTFTIGEPVVLFPDLMTREANLAVNTSEPEILAITIDTAPFDVVDPINGELPWFALYGAFYNPITLEQIGDPFIILGGTVDAEIETNGVKYNPVTNQYVVVTKANDFGNNGMDVPLIALVNPASVAAGGNPVAKAFAYDMETDQNYDDVAVAVNTRNGSFLLVAERNFVHEADPPATSEGVCGALFDKDGNLLTPQFGRLDTLEPDRDEDDPDVAYLEENDVFIFITNIDPSYSKNRITATIIQSAPDANGNLQAGTQQIVSELRKDFSAGHAAAIENPFTREFIGVLDYDNGAEGGDIFYFQIGPPPDYAFTEARPQIPYLEAAASSPYSQRHPQLAVDPNSGVIAIAHNATGEFQGMMFTLLGPDGAILPGRPNDRPYELVATDQAISSSANYHNIVYDPDSDSFIVIYATGDGWTEAVRLTVTSDHRPVGVADWMVY